MLAGVRFFHCEIHFFYFVWSQQRKNNVEPILVPCLHLIIDPVSTARTR